MTVRAPRSHPLGGAVRYLEDDVSTPVNKHAHPQHLQCWICAAVILALTACSQTPSKSTRNIYREASAPKTVAVEAPAVVEIVPAPEPQAAPPEKPAIPVVTEDAAVSDAPKPEDEKPIEPEIITAKPHMPAPPPSARVPEKTRADEADERPQISAEVDATCGRIARRLASVDYRDCVALQLTYAALRSVQGTPLVYKRYPRLPNRVPLGRVLVLGGTHGDELTSVSIVFAWMRTLDKHHSGLFEWLVAPLINPDGVLRNPAERTNANGVDVNRNFPTPDWTQRSQAYWRSVGKDRRRFPGEHPGSEPETRWTMELVEDFKPDVIVSVHAPLNLVDFDALDRSISPVQLGPIKKNLKGIFPGSLGNYAGQQRGIPVITLELPHSGIMPKGHTISSIWVDTVRWLRRNMDLAQAQQARAKPVLAEQTQ